MRKIIMASVVISLMLWTVDSYAACNYPDDRDSLERRCGGRAASVIPGGKLGGDGRYIDSQGRQRLYGRDNAPYDKSKSLNLYSGSQNSFKPYGR